MILWNILLCALQIGELSKAWFSTVYLQTLHDPDLLKDIPENPIMRYRRNVFDLS
jgi:hypothetical protein